MRNIFVYSCVCAVLAVVASARASVNADSAANYASGWETGSNGGGGFQPWSIEAGNGDGGASNGVWTSSSADLDMGNAFGYIAKGSGAFINLDRPFSQTMGTGDVFTLEFGLNYHSGTGGNRGFVLRTSDNKALVTINQGDSDLITVNGSTALTNAGTTTMHWTFTQSSPTLITVYATGRSGSEAVTVIVTNTSASYIAGIRFYATNVVNDEYADLRAVYFDNLVLSQSAGTNTFTYSVENSRATITAISETASGAVSVPGTLGGYTVSAIGRSAFKDRTNITSITFAAPANITNIEAMAFQGCSSLAMAVLPTAITSIPSGLFQGCTRLLSVTIPASVTNIGELAFADCRSLPSLALPPGLKTMGESALLNCRSLISLDLPSGASSIPGQFCYECRSLAAIDLPSGVTNIGYAAFYNCLSLASLNLPSSVSSLGTEAFCGCSGLTSFALNGAVGSISSRAFYGCGSLQHFYAYSSLGTLSSSVFGNCAVLTGVYFAGNAPTLSAGSEADMFTNPALVTVHRLATASNWGSTFCGAPLEDWQPEITTLATTSSAFSFEVDWITGQTIRVQACTNLLDPVWTDICTNTLTSGSCWISDTNWSANTRRFYRIDSPQN